MKKIVIFDLDGTLANTLESIAYCTNRALADFGFSPVASEKIRKFIGSGARTQTIRSLRAAGDQETVPIEGYLDDDGNNTVPLHLEEVLARYMEYFAVDCMYKVAPYEGICELLQQLKKKGISLAVFSNKPHPNAVSVTDLLFEEGTFTVVQGQKPEILKKPAPDGVFAIMEQVSQKTGQKITAADILYVGDSGVDMDTGKAAGVFTVGVCWGFRDSDELSAHGADALITKPEQLLELLS